MDYKSVGIIPAAGKATRFGGVLKELLPMPDGKTLLSHAYTRLSACDSVVVVTSPEKIEHHARALSGKQVIFVIQNRKRDILGAIQDGMLAMLGDRYYFTMPDTYMRDDAFSNAPPADFAMGLFITNTPERYGVLRDGHIINKRPDMPKPAKAWGALLWSNVTRNVWMEAETYTQAINIIIDKYRYKTWDIGEYFDNASVKDYLEFLKQS